DHSSSRMHASRLRGSFVPLCRKPERLAQPEPCRLRLHLRRGAFGPVFPERLDPSTVLLPERLWAISPSAADWLLSPADRLGRRCRPTTKHTVAQRRPFVTTPAARAAGCCFMPCSGAFERRKAICIRQALAVGRKTVELVLDL